MQLQSLSRRYTVRQLMETDVDAMLACAAATHSSTATTHPWPPKPAFWMICRLFRRAKRCRINILSAFMTVKRWPR